MDSFKAAAEEVLSNAEKSLRDIVSQAAQQGNYDAVRWLTDVSAQLLEVLEPGGGDHGSDEHIAPDSSDRFYREGENLLLRATSVRTGDSYEQRMSWPEVNSVLASIKKATQKGVVFKVGNLSPIADPDDKAKELPAYKARLVIRWLLQRDLLTRHGHRGYSCRARRELAADAERLWNELPKSEDG